MKLSEMNKIGKTQIYDKNSIVLDEQCTDTLIYIVLKGEVEVLEAKKKFGICIKTGNYFGGIPSLQDHIRLYSAIAREDNTAVFQIKTSTHNSLLEKCPEMYTKVFIRLLNNVRVGIDELNETDPVAATLYKLNAIYGRINLLKDSDLIEMVIKDLNYTVFIMRFLSDLSNKMNLKTV